MREKERHPLLIRTGLAFLTFSSLWLGSGQQLEEGKSVPPPPPSPTSGIYPENTPNPIFEPTPERPKKDLFKTLLGPFVKETHYRRVQWQENDPGYLQRVDKELNRRRVNFLLFGWGETHEPPITERAFIGSQTIISYEIDSRKISLISLTHDIRAPELERYQQKKGEEGGHPIKIGEAFRLGGFELMRPTLESATGLSIDFQVFFKDAIFKKLVDEVFEKVEVEVPQEFAVHPFYLEGKKYDQGYFSKGKQQMDGLRVIQFIKTVPIEAQAQKALEHNARKHLILEALLESFNQKRLEPFFWLKTLRFFNSEVNKKCLDFDFDVKTLVVNNIGTILEGMGQLLTDRDAGTSQPPEVEKKIYIVDSAHGDGGVRWVKAEAAVNPAIRKEMDEGVYEKLRRGQGDPYAIAIPEGGNPYAEDLVSEYWQSVRSLVKKSLSTEKQEVFGEEIQR